MNNTDEKKILIKDVIYNTKSLIVFELLGLQTVADLHLMYVLNTIPSLGTTVGLNSNGEEVIYDNAEKHAVERILATICGLKESKNVETQ